MSGNNRRVLLSTAQGLVSPTKLVIDFSSQKLYWLDSAAEKIGHVNFDGSQPFTQTISFLSQVSAMTVYRVKQELIYRKQIARQLHKHNLATSGESRRYVVDAFTRVASGGIWLRQESLIHILAFPGYAPRTIAINVTRLERGSMLVKRLSIRKSRSWHIFSM